MSDENSSSQSHCLQNRRLSKWPNVTTPCNPQEQVNNVRKHIDNQQMPHKKVANLRQPNKRGQRG